MAVPPNTDSHINDKSEGIISTANTNSRIDLPLDILAMNIPTKGDHDIHHAR
jgi:hypothetical protein